MPCCIPQQCRIKWMLVSILTAELHALRARSALVCTIECLERHPLKLPSTCRRDVKLFTHSLIRWRMVSSGMSATWCLPSARPPTSPVLFALVELIRLVALGVRCAFVRQLQRQQVDTRRCPIYRRGAATLAYWWAERTPNKHVYTHRSDELSNDTRWWPTTRRIVYVVQLVLRYSVLWIALLAFVQLAFDIQ